MSKQDDLQYEQQEKRIQAQSDAFITLLTKRGILGDSQIDDAQKRAARQEKTKNCYHNTLMLLQHYRTLVWMLECFPETVAAELDRPFEGVDKLIEDVDVEVALGNKRIVITWIILNSLGFIVAYLQPLISGGNYNP